MTNMNDSKKIWAGETGAINETMIKKYLNDLTSAICYLAGPPGMVGAMRKLLNSLGVNDDYIRTEEFAGY